LKIDITRFQNLLTDPINIAFAELPDTSNLYLDRVGAPLFDDVASVLGIPPLALYGCQFRGVPIDRLPTVLKTCIDVEPSDAPIYANVVSKALEYGGWPKLLIGLDTLKMRRTFKQVPSSISIDELTELRRTYPTMLTSKDGQKLWLSRLSEGDTNLGGSYEKAHGWWIPGNPKETLIAAIILVPIGGAGREQAMEMIKQSSLMH